MDLPVLDALPDPSRRAFVKTACCSALLLSLGLTTGCDSGAADDDNNAPPPPGSGIALSNNNNTITLDLTGSQANRVAAAGGFLYISQAKTLVINDGGTIRAFTSVCTHEACDIDSFSNGRFTCPCHGSQYDTNGHVTRGPASRSLTAFAVERSGDTVTITRA